MVVVVVVVVEVVVVLVVVVVVGGGGGGGGTDPAPTHPGRGPASWRPAAQGRQAEVRSASGAPCLLSSNTEMVVVGICV